MHTVWATFIRVAVLKVKHTFTHEYMTLSENYSNLKRRQIDEQIELFTGRLCKFKASLGCLPPNLLRLSKNNPFWGWRDGLAVEDTC